MQSLTSAPGGKKLRIKEIQGGHRVKQRLLAMGFHKNDLIELDSRGFLGGPVLVRNLNSDASVALGRGIAGKILVEVVE